MKYNLNFKNLPIKYKLIIFIVFISVFTSIIALTLDYLLIVEEYKSTFFQTVKSEGELISQYCALPIEFNYPDKATEILKKTSTIKYIHNAIIFDMNHSVFASNENNTVKEILQIEFLKDIESREIYKDGYYHILIDIKNEDRNFGHLYLIAKSNLDEIIKRKLIFTSTLILGVILIAFLLTLYLQRFITKPLTELSKFTHNFSTNKDYTKRIFNESNDEIGYLYKEFNNMLDVINHRDNELQEILIALRDSENKYRSIIENIEDVYYRSDNSGNLIMISPSGLKYFGYDSEDEIIGKSITDILYNYSNDREEFIKELSKNRMVQDYELTLKDKNGNQLLASTTSQFYYDTFNNIIGIEGIIRDISNRKRIQQALESSEENLRITLQSIGDGVISLDENSFITLINPIAQELTGWKDDTAIGLTVNEVFSLYDPITKSELKYSIFDSLLVYNLDSMDSVFLLKSKVGLEYKISNSVAPIRNSINDIIGAVIVFKDITNEYEKEIQLKKREVQFQSIFENSPYAITINRISDKKFLKVNSSFIEITGFSIEEILGKPYDTFIAEDSKDLVKNTIAELFSKGVVHSINGKILNKAEDLLEVIASFSLIEYDGDECVLTSILDITQLRRVEEQLRQSQKMDVVGQLAGGIAHDFNNVLGGIMGYAEVISLISDNEPKIKSYSNTILVAAKKASELINQLLAFSRKDKIINKTFDSIETINSTVTLLEHSINKSIEIVKDFKSIHNLISGDSNLIQNAILNIAINARDAMPEGGKIIFSTENVYLDENFSDRHNFSIAEGHYLEISITDTGSGISKENLNKIFEPFFTTKPVGKGTGLGLAAVYGTIKDHKGLINVYSEIGYGTSFKLYLPLDKDNINLNVEVVGKLITGKGSILVVDDERFIREMVMEFLTSIGYEVESAIDGLDALEKFVPNKFDLIILDLIMPQLGGKETLLKIMEINPSEKVLIASGYNPEGSFEQLLRLGAKAYIKKPYILTEFSRIIFEIINNN